jgi:hypothetical protein
MQTLVITRGDDPDARAGTHHGLVMKAVRSVWAAWGQKILDLAVLTTDPDLMQQGGHGRRTVSVGGSGGNSPDAEGSAAGQEARLVVPGQVEALLTGYDLAFVLLSESLLSAVRLPLEVPDRLQMVFLTNQDSLGLVPEMDGVETIVADGAVAARRWHVKADRVRGFLFGRLCGQIVEHGPALLEWLHRRPQDTESLFYKRARWRPQWPLWDV